MVNLPRVQKSIHHHQQIPTSLAQLAAHMRLDNLRGGALPLIQATTKLFADASATHNTNIRRLPMLHRHVRGLVFGGMDGILTTFALLAAVAGSRQTSISLTLVIGVSTVLADALSMAAGEYLSAKAETEVAGALAADTSEPSPLEKGAAMFCAFTLFGSMPLLGYIVAAALTAHAGASQISPDHFLVSVAITAITLFVLGTIKSTFGGSATWWQSGLEVGAVGGCAACVAFYTAKIVDKLIG